MLYIHYAIYIYSKNNNNILYEKNNTSASASCTLYYYYFSVFNKFHLLPLSYNDIFIAIFFIITKTHHKCKYIIHASARMLSINLFDVFCNSTLMTSIKRPSACRYIWYFDIFSFNSSSYIIFIITLNEFSYIFLSELSYKLHSCIISINIVILYNIYLYIDENWLYNFIRVSPQSSHPEGGALRRLHVCHRLPGAELSCIIFTL